MLANPKKLALEFLSIYLIIMLLRIFLIIFGSVLALAGSEVIVRLLDIAPEVAMLHKGRFRLSRNPMIGYEPIPGLDYHGEELSYYDYLGQTNSLGFRDYEHPLKKPPGNYRIVVLGDSIAAGLRIEKYQDTFPAILERELRAQGMQAEVINLGVSGYNTRQEIETLKERGLQFKPDLVILQYCLNDRWRDDGLVLRTLLDEENKSDQLVWSQLSPLLVKSALFRFARFKAFPNLWFRSNRDDTENHFSALASDSVDQSIRELAGLSKRHGFEVLVAIFPRFESLEEYQFREEHGAVRELSEATGIRVLDLLPGFIECISSGSKVDFDNFHPNPEGHACAARALNREVSR
jgi:lysophospholipase L1-like esterase